MGLVILELLFRLVGVAIDAALLFTLTRILAARFPNWKLVSAFDSAGRPIVDHMLRSFDYRALQPNRGKLRQGGKLGIWVMLLVILDLVFGSIVVFRSSVFIMGS